MKLVVNDNTVELDEPADRTALQYLRASGLTGTKEGCASGDCGACTVMVSEIVNGSVHYRTLNACLVPVGQLAGKRIVTVEGLADEFGLHPAQDEMVQCHGSQCGFCTPGFVMSLAALVENKKVENKKVENKKVENKKPATRESVLQAISGNLCRCTGYRPIVQAGLNALSRSHDSRLKHVDTPMHSVFDPVAAVLRPQTEQALQQSLQRYPEAPLIAGGTDLMLEVTQRLQSFERLIDVSDIQTLRAISETAEDYSLGATVPYTELEAFFEDRSAPLVSLLHRLGSRQIRNSGTLGGNLANGSPIADMPPVLIGWDATLDICSSEGQTRQVKVDEFYTGYRETVLQDDEYIARVRIPKRWVNAFTRFYKSSKRIEDDISSVMGAFVFEGDGRTITGARIAFGGMAATPVRLKDIESSLTGKRLDDELVTAVTLALDEAMTPLTDVRASAAYRSAMARSMLARALAEFRGTPQPLVMELNLDA